MGGPRKKQCPPPLLDPADILNVSRFVRRVVPTTIILLTFYTLSELQKQRRLQVPFLLLRQKALVPRPPGSPHQTPLLPRLLLHTLPLTNQQEARRDHPPGLQEHNKPVRAVPVQLQVFWQGVWGGKGGDLGGWDRVAGVGWEDCGISGRASN